MATYVQFGCFTDCPDGWENFEPSIYLRASRVPVLGRLLIPFLPFHFPSGIKVGDIVLGLPLEESTVDVVFSSHVLEHLTYEEFRIALKNVYKILKRGGKFRLVVPDIESRARFYLENAEKIKCPANWFMRSTMLGQTRRKSYALSSILKFIFSSSEHKWMWDYKTLKSELELCGFTEIQRIAYSHSSDEKISSVEKEDRFFWSPGQWPGIPPEFKEQRFEELAMECTK